MYFTQNVHNSQNIYPKSKYLQYHLIIDHLISFPHYQLNQLKVKRFGIIIINNHIINAV